MAHTLSPSSKPKLDQIDVPLISTYDWLYDHGSERLKKLYELGKKYSWNETADIDWNCPTPSITKALPKNFRCEWSGLPHFENLSSESKLQFLKDYHGWGFSQILHGEQGALLVASQLVSSVPSMAAKKLASSQAYDESRHVAVIKRYIDIRFNNHHPVSSALKALLDRILSSPDWDVKFVGMQLIIENLALANFRQLRLSPFDSLLQRIIKYITQDEARHVAFGLEYLRDYIVELSPEQISSRAYFAYEACVLARNSIKPIEIWTKYGWPIDECEDFFKLTRTYQEFHINFSQRVIPHLHRIGLLSEEVVGQYASLGMDIEIYNNLAETN